MKLSENTAVRAHLASAGIAGGYALGLHLLVWLSYVVAYLASGGWSLVISATLLGAIIIGIIGFFIIKRLAPERVTFYASLLLCHILLALVFLPVGGPLIGVLQEAAGIVLTGAPEENFDGLFFLADWLILAVGMGLFFFLAGVISLVREALRRAWGTVPKEKKIKH